jgi:hypothetical protein
MVDGFCKKELPYGKVAGLTYNDLVETLAWVMLRHLGEIVRAILKNIETLYLVNRGGLIFMVVHRHILCGNYFGGHFIH